MKRNPMLITVLCFAILGVIVACGPTSTPVPPTATATTPPTPAPTATLTPGWKRFENNGVSLAMPDTFAGGAMTAENQQNILKMLESSGDDYAQFAEALKKYPDIYVLFIIDADFDSVTVGRQKISPTMDIDSYAEMIKKQLPAALKLKSQEDVMIQGTPAIRLIIESGIGGADVTQAGYVIKHGAYFYTISYSTDSVAFREKLPVFEQSIQTFTIEP